MANTNATGADKLFAQAMAYKGIKAVGYGLSQSLHKTFRYVVRCVIRDNSCRHNIDYTYIDKKLKDLSNRDFIYKTHNLKSVIEISLQDISFSPEEIQRVLIEIHKL